MHRAGVDGDKYINLIFDRYNLTPILIVVLVVIIVASFVAWTIRGVPRGVFWLGLLGFGHILNMMSSRVPRVFGILLCNFNVLFMVCNSLAWAVITSSGKIKFSSFTKHALCFCRQRIHIPYHATRFLTLPPHRARLLVGRANCSGGFDHDDWIYAPHGRCHCELKGDQCSQTLLALALALPTVLVS